MKLLIRQFSPSLQFLTNTEVWSSSFLLLLSLPLRLVAFLFALYYKEAVLVSIFSTTLRLTHSALGLCHHSALLFLVRY
ncbi:hypothetical protein IE53DRAFT_213472 [Violaceomyces palustris]|uniref:Uncharacterized protein n=1 Tax=Violaceomyces palustris TaxID=1673888 RepID=A0ACD0P4W3_9BASI|nr:hypothetical protein IE53DRAFT_213472 [Violaceomyces palustris]